jgi:hypothetical protein
MTSNQKCNEQQLVAAPHPGSVSYIKNITSSEIMQRVFITVKK